ncbi:peptide-N-glycosidase F-related protein [Psychroserpens sp.]|uniref:peptide-N-glycosidase F-related protein n=1 Tax=Psychroserpens sp. TaxID=2020870 RepID=UPI002B26CD4D|nr:peptide-N-glycosidase F-related protein [Psychroserpens sp.]
MTTRNLKKSLGILVFVLGLLFIVNCSGDDTSSNEVQQQIITPSMSVNNMSFNFVGTQVSSNSDSFILFVNGDNLESLINITSTEGFQVSLDGTTFSNSLQIASESVNGQTSVFVRFSPMAIGSVTGTLTVANSETDNIVVSLAGVGLPIVHNYSTFVSERLAFGGGFSQSSTQVFNLHDDLTSIETIKMFVKLRCPAGGCDEWDVYANVKVKDDASGELYEIGRYITPYWNDNSQLNRGFEFDVTDFKSLLTGSTELRIRTECWNANGYEVSVEFDYIEGTPDYPYYAVSRVLAYDDWSSSGVPYGVAHSFDLTRSVSIPANTESTHLRTIISGWGHATPNDSDGRPCAEWCYRTHDVKIDGAPMFQHNLSPLGCASNPVSNQNPGNWQPDRAGWCPGMVVPARLNQFNSSMAGSSFSFEYDYEDWISDIAGGNAFYATSTFVVVKSNTPISKPVVSD